MTHRFPAILRCLDEALLIIAPVIVIAKDATVFWVGVADVAQLADTVTAKEVI
jgi:hypothetical protein